MNPDVKMAKHAVLDKFEAQIQTAEAKLDTLKARAETAKANVEIKAIAELLTRKHAIQRELHELKKAAGSHGKHSTVDLEARIADFEKSVKSLESKLKAS